MKNSADQEEFFISQESRIIIYSKYFQTLKGENELFDFMRTKNNETSSRGFLGQRFNNLQRDALLTSVVQYDKIVSEFGQQQLLMVNYAYGLNHQKPENILND